MNVLLPTLGSAGDVHPFIALGTALEARGHRATIITTPLFQPLIEAQGLRYLPVGTLEQVRAAIAHPDLWHLRKGFEVLARVFIPAIGEIYRLIEKHADANTVVAFSTGAFGARVAQEKLGIPSASIHLQPTVIRSVVDQGMYGNIRLSASHPRWFKHGLFGLVDWLILDRRMKRPLNEFRATLGLAPVDRVMHRWMHSPQLVIAFFPEWFAPLQPDWPANTHAVGFPLWDLGGEAAPLQAAEEFLNAGAAPVIFTPGSAGSTGGNGGIRLSALQPGAAASRAVGVSRRRRYVGAGNQGRNSASGGAQRLRSVRQRLAHRATGLGHVYSPEPLSRAASGRSHSRDSVEWPISGEPQGIRVACRRRPRHCARLRFDRRIGSARMRRGVAWSSRAAMKNGADRLRVHAAKDSHQRGSWLVCRREILLNHQFHPAKITHDEKRTLYIQ
jgi:hypothetical protein